MSVDNKWNEQRRGERLGYAVQDYCIVIHALVHSM